MKEAFSSLVLLQVAVFNVHSCWAYGVKGLMHNVWQMAVRKKICVSVYICEFCIFHQVCVNVPALLVEGQG